MKLISIEALPVRLPRELVSATGTAGSPTPLTRGAGRYLWSESYPAVYSTAFETALVRVCTDGGLVGWGEAQAPVAPEIACAIIGTLLGPLLEGAEFSGTPEGIAALWDRMYSSMRVRGQTGGFMLDAIAGIDLALWDLAGKTAGLPVSRLLTTGAVRRRIPVYLSGLAGPTLEARLRFAREHRARAVKIYLGKSTREVLETMDGVCDTLGPETRVAVDALWHLNEEEAMEFGSELDRRNALWLECPFPPEDRSGSGCPGPPSCRCTS